ncbi:MAG: hypothetical protein AM326_08370 [Candidatus Thorarchaeota archaeon SMTZ-45]|nr:MAG: hypothetical protein AM325_00665 [Candidatus Thorarchaeota archaeon SMTZ1-45]KXH75880.1 MAG: hypothetical protein AM326_08370 [Candidatus Thorarchaeota archaeon SMTZ-45]
MERQCVQEEVAATSNVTVMVRLNSDVSVHHQLMFDSSLVVASICAGAIISSLIVGVCLRFIYENIKSRVVANAILIILGAFGVFFTIFGWSWMFFQVPNREQFLPIFGFSVLYSLVFGLVLTSGLNKTESKKRKW